MADSWDADDFEPPPVPIFHDIKESWEDEDPEEPKPTPAVGQTGTKASKKKNKFKKFDVNGTGEVEDPGRELTEREREDRQRNSELNLLLDNFGAEDTDLGPFTIKLDSREDSDESAKQMALRLTSLKRSKHYVPFLEEIFRQLCLSLESDHAKQLAKSVNLTAQELAKREKEIEQAAKKKAKAKPTLKKGGDDPFDFDGSLGAGAANIDDDEDFM